jgi:hydrogenase maturation factor
MTVKIKKQILQVRDTALTNMLDFQGVKQVAIDLGLLELVAYIDEHPDEYGDFILYGKE